jgi:hypothetical protein
MRNSEYPKGKVKRFLWAPSALWPGKVAWWPLNKRLCRSQNTRMSQHFGVESNPFCLSVIELQYLVLPRTFVTRHCVAEVFSYLMNLRVNFM